MIDVSVILPVYNEVDKLEHTVETTIKELTKIIPSFEIIIAEDGSTDGTDTIAAELMCEYTFVKHLHNSKRLGKGSALKRACKNAKGSTIVYFDVDLATDIKHLEELINSIEKEGYDFATGSRLLSKSKVKRTLKREIASGVYNFLVKTLLRSKVHDHQCGFKSFKKASLFSILDNVKNNHWFWDTEMLVRAQRRGFDVKEFPVTWIQGTTTKVDLLNDSIRMCSKIIGLWWELKKDDQNTPEN